MIWKECGGTFSAPSLLRMVISIILGLGATAGLGYWVYAMGLPACQEVHDYGYSAGGIQTYREAMSVSVRIFTAVLYILSGLLLAAAAATGVTSEREKDTWVSLTATPLSGPEILQGKMLGAVWRVRLPLGALLLVWLIGLVCGAVHPLGFVLAIVVTTVYVGFITMLGAYLSLVSRGSARAISATIAILLLLNGGYLFCCIPMMADPPGSGAELVTAGITPLIVTISPFSYQDLDEFLCHNYRETPMFILTGIVSLGLYGLTAVGLYHSCLNRFDIEAGRPPGDYLKSPGNASREGIMFADEAETSDEGIEFIEGSEEVGEVRVIDESAAADETT
jgi:ABC-type transport system involved in multi-copper enzyme maturation permease subunit